MVTFYDFFCVMTVHYLRSNLSNNGPLFAPQIPDNPTRWIWTMQEIKLSDIICFPARPFCMHLKLKGLELFVNSSLPLPHVPSPASSFYNSSTAVFMTNNQNYAFKFSYLWSTIVSYGACIHFHCQFSTLYCASEIYYYIFCWQHFRGTLSSYKPLATQSSDIRQTHTR